MQLFKIYVHTAIYFLARTTQAIILHHQQLLILHVLTLTLLATQLTLVQISYSRES